MSFSLSIAQRGIPPQINPGWDAAIQSAAGGDAGFDSLIRGVISAESGWMPLAFRPEPRINDASQGLMQVLLRTAQGIRPGITREQLADPMTNIEVGSRFLAGLRAQYHNDSDAISAYNHGSPWRKPDGGYYNQTYVDDVLTYANYFMNQVQPVQMPGDEAVSGEPGAPVEPPSPFIWIALLAAGILAAVLGGRR